jgi:photosystem II stability/assembly factor-like uncharacterized protein
MRTLKISLLVFTISIYSQTIQWQETNIEPGHAIMYLTSNSSGDIFASRSGDFNTGKIYRTTDMGSSWTLQTNGLIPAGHHILEVNSNDVVFAGGYYGVSYSTNNGESWLTTAPTPENLIAMGIDFNNDIYISCFPPPDYFFYKSTDNGNSWILLTNGLSSFGVNGIAFSSDGYIYVTAYSNQIGQGKVFYSTNHGANWVSSSMSFGNLSNIAVSINNDVYTTSYGENIYRSTNHGSSWDLVNNTIHYISDLKTNQLGHIFLTAAYFGVFRSTDNGNSWDSVNNGLNELYLGSLTIDPSGFIYTGLGGTPGKIWRTIESSIPVELISFTTTLIDKEIILSWSTATETNNSGFEILRSTKDNDWNKIGFVPGHGTTTETQHYSFTDNDVKSGKYQYKLKQIDYNGTFEYSQIVEVEIPFVNEFSLSQNYPNPFNPVTKIKFTIPTPPVSSPLLKERTKEGFATLKVYDVLGNEIATLINEEKPAGEYEIEFNAANLPSGIYFYQLKAGQYSETKKMILIR